MAYVMNLGDETDIVWLYNVSYPVGPRGSNRDDVQLVQHAINIIHNTYLLYDDSGRLIMADLKRDGICGPRTIEGIAAYQRNVGTRRKLVKADGNVDPSSYTGWTAHSDVQFTIVHLNRDVRDITGTMMKEDDFPEPLRSIIKNGKIR
jgi:hypothetical protein